MEVRLSRDIISKSRKSKCWSGKVGDFGVAVSWQEQMDDYENPIDYVTLNIEHEYDEDKYYYNGGYGELGDVVRMIKRWFSKEGIEIDNVRFA